MARMWVILFVFCCLVQSQTIPNTDNSASINDRISALEQRCIQQQETIRQLENQSNYASPEYTKQIVQEYLQKSQAQEEEDGISTGYDEGFFIRNSDSSFELKFTGFLQMGAGFFEKQSYDKNGFFPQGVFLILDVNFLENFHVHLEGDFADTGNWDQFQSNSGLEFALYENYIEYTLIPELSVRAGSLYLPFSLTGSHYYSENPMIFYEPFVNSFDFGYDLGIMITGLWKDQWEYSLVFSNGNGTANDSNDDKLALAQLNWYFLGCEKNPDTFVHIAGMFSKASDDDYNEAVIYSGWGRQLYDGNGLNPHADEYGSPKTSESLTRGWKMGADAGLRWSHDFENDSNLYTEIEAMYMQWERKLSTGKLSSLYGWGFLFSVAYRYPICKNVEGSGIIPAFAFSYTDLDNRSTHEAKHASGPEPNIRGQTVFNYTFGLGYAFNQHAKVNFNWIMMDVANPNINPSKNRANPREGLEHGFFVQATLSW